MNSSGSKNYINNTWDTKEIQLIRSPFFAVENIRSCCGCRLSARQDNDRKIKIENDNDHVANCFCSV